MYNKKDEAEINKALKELRKGDPAHHMKKHLYDEAKRRFLNEDKKNKPEEKKEDKPDMKMKKKELYDLAKKHKDKHKIKPKKALSQMNKKELLEYLDTKQNENNKIDTEGNKKKKADVLKKARESKAKKNGEKAYKKWYYANKQNLENIKKAEKKLKKDKDKKEVKKEKKEEKIININKQELAKEAKRTKLKKAEKIKLVKKIVKKYNKNGGIYEMKGIPQELIKKAQEIYKSQSKKDDKPMVKKEKKEEKKEVKRKENKDLEEKKILQERKKKNLKKGAYEINDPERYKELYDSYMNDSIEELKKDIKKKKMIKYYMLEQTNEVIIARDYIN